MSAGVRKEPWSVLEAEARALLRRAEAPPLARLIAMIRDVNPTGRRVGRSEADARYAVKASLQSVLIRLYRDELSAEPHPSDGGVVSLRHDLLDVDACHAVVESLDDDARTWVEEAITGAPAAPRAGRDARAKGARSARREGVEREGDLVAQGRAAMEAYDYELARSLFVRAFEAVPATTEATLALLDLLVDALASDEEALAIVPRITPAAMGSPEVIARLAIAAARAEREELALQWATACTSPRGVDAFDVLARAALRRGDTARAADLLATVRDRAPSHPSVVSIEAEIAGARAAARAPVERAAAEAVERGDFDEAERIAREVFAQWPESEVARKALRRCADRRLALDIAAARGRVEEALARGDADDAERSLARLGALGSADGELASRVAELRAALVARDLDVLFETLMADIAHGDLASVLARWSVLPLPVRSRVRKASNEPVFGWIERVGDSDGADSAEVVRALLTLRHATLAQPAASPSEIIGALAPYESVLRGVAVARSLLADARAAMRASASAANAGHLSAARSALAAGAMDLVRAHLRAVRPEQLDELHLAELRDVEAAVGVADRVSALETQIEALRAAGDAVHAAARIDDRLALEPLRDAERWRSLRDELRGSARGAFRVAVVDGRGASSEIADLSMRMPPAEEPSVVLSPDGCDAAFAVTRGRWVFVRLATVPDGTVFRRISLETPAALGHVHVVRHGSRLEVVGDEGRAVIVDIDVGDILDWIDVSAVVGADRRVESVHLVDHGRVAWVETFTPLREAERLIVVETATGEVVRDLAAAHARQVFGDPEVQGLTQLHGEETRFLSARGTGVPWARILDRNISVSGVTVHPARRALVALSTEFDEIDPPAALTFLAHEGRASFTIPLEGTYGESSGLVATSRAHRAICVDAASREGSDRRLLWFSTEDTVPKLEHALPYNGDSAMLADADQRHLVWMRPTREGVVIRALPEAFATEDGADRGWRRIGGTHSFWRCDRPYHTLPAPQAPIPALLRATPSEAAAIVERLRAAAVRPEDYIDLASSLHMSNQPATARPTLRLGCSRHPGHWALLDALVEDLMAEGLWADVLEALEGPAARDDAPAHIVHLLGVALLWCARHDEGREALLRAKAMEGCKCDVDDALEIAGAHSAAEASDGIAAWIIGACVEADAAIGASDPVAAIHVLHRPPLLGGREVQGLARLAAAHLAVPASDAIARFQKALALMEFVHRHEVPRTFREELPLRARWPTEHLDALATTCKRWMDDVFATGAVDRVMRG